MKLKYWLALSFIFQHAPIKVIRLYTSNYAIEEIFSRDSSRLKSLGFSTSEIKGLLQPDWEKVTTELDRCQRERITLITLQDDEYPDLLKQIADPPLVLYVRGNPKILHELQIGIVGSRHASIHGKQHAKRFAECLGAHGFVVTSGLARGIDGAVHEAAVQNHRPTIAVIGTGLLRMYPQEHKRLVHDIIEQQGAVVSEFPLLTPPFAQNFPRRNRLIAGLTKGVLVVEARLKSGSLITARHALEAGRDVFAIPGAIHQPWSEGCNHLIQQGAKLCQYPQDIIEEYGHYRPNTLPKETVSKESAGFSAQELQVLQALSDEMTQIDMIILRSRLTADEVSSILLILELKGYVIKARGSYYLAHGKMNA